MSERISTLHKKPLIMGAGLMVLDIILNNGDTQPMFRAGGTCGNVLAGLSYLGWKSNAIARIGTDYAGKVMANDLSNCGVDISFIGREEELKTPRIIERLSSNGYQPKHTFLLRCTACHAYLPRFRSPTLGTADSVVSINISPVVFFFDRVSPAILKLARTYRESGALIFFEPNNLNSLEDIEPAVTLCHVLKYSGDETKKGTPDKGDHHMQELKPPLIIKTLGKGGLMFNRSKSKAWHYQRGVLVDNLKDTCGAGDWCTIGFLYFLNAFAAVRHISLAEALEQYKLVNGALQHAQVMSALSCGFVGARGLSDTVDGSVLKQTIHHHLTHNTDINDVMGRLTAKKNPTLKRNIKTADKTTCPVCLSSLQLERNVRSGLYRAGKIDKQHGGISELASRR